MKTIILLLLVISMRVNAQSDSTVDSNKLNEFISMNSEIYTDEFMLIHRGKQIIHWKDNKCDSVYFNTASMVKSWTGLVVGTLVDKGYVDSELDMVCEYIPEWEEGCKYDVSIRNLLNMSAGINKRSGAQGILDETDMNQYAINIELDTFPNVRWSYSNESVQLLGVLIENVTGKSVSEYIQEVLLIPLGMDSTSFYVDESGNDIVFGGARTTVEDASKIALLMANGGNFYGNQIVSEKWIQKSLSPSEKSSSYGYLWWLDNNSENRNYAAMGDFGQLTIVFPDLELIYIRKQACNKDVSGNMRFMGPRFLEMIANLVN